MINASKLRSEQGCEISVKTRVLYGCEVAVWLQSHSEPLRATVAVKEKEEIRRRRKWRKRMMWVTTRRRRNRKWRKLGGGASRAEGVGGKTEEDDNDEEGMMPVFTSGCKWLCQKNVQT